MCSTCTAGSRKSAHRIPSSLAAATHSPHRPVAFSEMNHSPKYNSAEHCRSCTSPEESPDGLPGKGGSAGYDGKQDQNLGSFGNVKCSGDAQVVVVLNQQPGESNVQQDSPDSDQDGRAGVTTAKEKQYQDCFYGKKDHPQTIYL